MVHLEVLKEHKCTVDEIKSVCTCEDVNDPKSEFRKKLEDEIRASVDDGLALSLRGHRMMLAADMAWDAPPLAKEQVSLMEYATGLVSESDLIKRFSEDGVLEDFCDKDSKGQYRISAKRMLDTPIHLIRSYITRRVAAQVARYDVNPYFKYDPRGTSEVDKFRADVLTQRVDIMADQYGYRHQWEQNIRDMFLYSRSVLFPVSAWDCEKQIIPLKGKGVFENISELEPVPVREGLQFVNPHPNRVFCDPSAPMAAINTDTGPQWIGYFDVVRYKTIRYNPNYWNRETVAYNESLISLWEKYPEYFSYYFNGISKPTMEVLRNDLKNNVAVNYSSDQKDAGAIITVFNKKLIPKDYGIGTYPFPVWIRFVVANSGTILYGEPLPSIPAAYGGINVNDSKLVNLSMAHEIMPIQDHVRNILTHMLRDMKQSLMQVWAIDQDALPGKLKNYLKDKINTKDWIVEPHAFFYSGKAMKDLNLDPKGFIEVLQRQVTSNVSESFKAVSQLLGILEKLLVLSPQELGQVAPREASASEIVEIASSVQSMYTFISQGIDEQRAAVKKMIFESLVSKKRKIRVPVVNRYLPKTVEAAGFHIDDLKDDVVIPYKRQRFNVVGDVDHLGMEFRFTSRDGDTRVSDSEAAKTMVQLIGVLPLEEVVKREGWGKFAKMVNEIWRKAGATDLLLEEGEAAEDQTAQGGLDLKDPKVAQEFISAMQEIGQSVQELTGRIQTIEQGLGIQNEQTQQPTGQGQPGQEQPGEGQPAEGQPAEGQPAGI